MWHSFTDFLARNRTTFGYCLFLGWGALQADPDYQKYLAENTKPRIANSVAVAMIGYVAGAGSHDSDRRQREKQAIEKAMDE